MQKKIIKWIAPALKIVSTLIVVILLATVVGQTSVYPYLIVGVCTLEPFVFRLAKRLFRLKMPTWVEFFALIFVILAADLGSGMGLYKKIDCYDLIVHGIFGLLCSTISLYFLYRFSGNFPKAPGISCIFLITMGFAALWECWEFTIDLIFRQGAQLGLVDTMTDILIAAAGAIVFVFAYLIDARAGGKLFRIFDEGAQPVSV